MNAPHSMDTQVRAFSDMMCNGVKIYAVGPLRDGKRPVGVMHWEECDQMDEYPVALRVPVEQAQGLMDDLWNAGVRPTDGNGSAGAMRAAERHIADLRAVAFKTLGITLG